MSTLFLTLDAAAKNQQESSFYAHIGGAWSIFRVQDSTFNPVLSEFRVGAYIDKQVGVELYGATSLSDDESQSTALEADIESIYGVTLRLESPEEYEAKLSILLGYAQSKVNLDLDESGFPGDETLSGFSYGLAWDKRLSSSYFFGISAQRYFDDDEVSVDAFGLYLRTEF